MDYMIGIHITVIISVLLLIRLAFPRKFGNVPKTTIKIEIPACDRDSQNGLSIDNVKLYNNGKMLSAKKVRAIWGENSTIILEFKKLTKFEDCTLSFTLNGEAVSMNLQTNQIRITDLPVYRP